jgi:hypothetical protein
MKRLSMIAAGLLALGLTAARAETAGKSNTTVEVVPPTAPGTDANGNPKTPSDIDVNPNPNPTPVPENRAVSPSPAVPGTTEALPPPPANVNVDVNPTQPVQPSVPLTQPSARPPARVIDANTAAINGAVMAPVIPVGPAPFYPPQPKQAYPLDHTWVSRMGTGILVGGGFEDFTNNTMQNMTGTAGMWTARVLAGTRRFFGVEAAYVGNARSIDALGLQSSATLVGNGVEGDARVNAPIVMRHAQLLEPFAFAGIGWQHYQLTNTNTFTSDLARDDDVMAVPLGGGLEYAVGRFMADARFTYRATYYNDLLLRGGNLNTYGVATQIGFSF